jgi:putative YphP/YqiW family bacilliredoxin
MFETMSPRGPMYDETMLAPMRRELLEAGFTELRTREDVERAFATPAGTALLVVNSVCGCAAGSARPGVVRAVSGTPRPDRLLTVFAGQDREATEAARERIAGYRPSSPSIALFRDGSPVFVLERRQIEGRAPEEISKILTGAIAEHCRKGAGTPE